jgi:hypothetical protein
MLVRARARGPARPSQMDRECYCFAVAAAAGGNKTCVKKESTVKFKEQ